MDVEKISNIIKNKRKEKGLTQEELAKRINVTEKAISRWETGRGTPDISLLIPLSEELNISVSELLKGSESKKDNENIKEIVDYIDKNKKNKNKFVIPISACIYVLLLLLYLWYLRIEYSNIGYSIGNFHFTYLGELIINIIFIISVFLTNRFIANNYYDSLDDRERMNKISYIISLVIYLIMIFNLTIFKRELHGYSYNLIPFKTILGYCGFPASNNIFVNIIGNIVVMMPVQFLIIKIFKQINFRKCLIIDIALVLLVETIQLIAHTGIFDVDDMILNLVGMLAMYALTMKSRKKKYL